MSVFDKIGRLLTKTSLDSEFDDSGQSNLRVSDKSIQGVLEDIYSELRFQREFQNKRKQGVELIDEGNIAFGVARKGNMQKVILGEPAEITYGDSSVLDAFKRVRVSNPVNEFTSEFQYNKHPLFYEELTAVNGTVSHNAPFSAVDLNVTTDDGSQAGVQSYEYFRYQPGKSLMIAMTFIMPLRQAGTNMQSGYFDDENGFFFEIKGTTAQFVRRSKTSGSVVDNAVEQGDWNFDKMDGTGPSGVTLDFTKSQQLRIDLQWLSNGRIRMCWDINGAVVLAHEFQIANVLSTPSTTTANLPVRWLMTNTSAPASAKTMQAICVSVATEGGDQTELGHPFTGGNGVTTRTVSTVPYPICSIRPATSLNSITNRARVRIESLEILTSNDVLWQLVYAPTSITNASFGAPVSHSAVQVDVAGTAIVGGVIIDGGYIAGGSGNTRGAGATPVTSKLPFALDKAGTNQSRGLSVVLTRVGAQDAVAAAQINWTEIR